MFGQDLYFWALALPAAFVVGMSKGGLGSVGMLGVPILSLVIPPVAAAGLLLPIFIVSDWFGLWAFRRDYSAENLKTILTGAILGVVAGWMLASVVPEAWVRLVIGGIGVTFCVDRFRQRGRTPVPKPGTWPRGLFWGVITGFTSFVSHSGAPPFQVYVLPQHLPKMVYAGTATIAFAVINMLKLPPYIALGQVSVTNLRLTMVLAVVAVLGVFAGLRLTRILPERPFFAIVTTLLFLVSLKLTWDGIAGIL